MYDEVKKKQTFSLTPTVWKVLGEVAERLDTNRSESVEQLARCLKPDDILRAIANRVAANGGNLTDVMIAALRRGFDSPDFKPDLLGRVEVLSAKLEESRKEHLSQPSQKIQPDYEAVRDHILLNWKIAKGAEKLERIKKALDLFIAELSFDNS